jgi:gliding motility-associated-like protein
VTTVTWTVTDNSGNTATCTQNVTVTDNVNPTISCPAAVAATTNSGCTATGVALGTPTTSDNCGVASVTNDAPGAFPIGVTTVTWTVTDNSGNTATCTQNVTVTDNVNPTISCPAAVAATTNSGCTATGVALGTPVTGDNCGVASVTNDAPVAFPIGVTTVTWTVTDNSGNTATCTQNVTVTDNVNPTISCPAAVAATTNSGCTATGVALGTPVTGDNCGVASVTNDAPVAFPIGVTTVTWTVTDGAGNAATCTQAVTVTDNVNPTISCPAAVAVFTNSGCTATGVALGTPTTSDNCGVASVTNDAPVAFPIGVTTVTWTVTDNSGNTATCTQNVTVTDNVNPTISCPAAVAATTNSGCTATGVALGTPVTGDNCGVASVTNDAPVAFPIGLTTVTWTVTDNSGNTATCTQNVTVTDNVNPTISCPAAVAATTNSGCTATGVALGTPTTSDNCGVASVTNDAPVAFPIGVTTVTWTVTDNSGNTATCTQNVTVTDNVNPTISCPAAVAATTNSGCTATGVALGTPTTSDNCGVASVTNDAPVAFPIGVTTVTWTVTDNSGNTATCTQNVTVVDNVNPTISCPAAVAATTNSGCTATGVALGTPVTGDNCGVASVTNDAPGAFPIGVTTVTWTVTDNSGNTATCTQNVTVTDNVNPTISCPAAVAATTNSGCTATGVALGTPVTGDNCGVASVTNDAPVAFPLGVTTVTWTVTDNSGNTATCTQNVTVTDNVNPVAICQPVTANLNGGGIATITAAQVDNGSSDNCGVASLSLTTYQYFAVGTYTDTLIVADAAGNVDSCFATITVVDNNPPNAVCNDTTLYLDAAGSASITPADLDGGSTDNGVITALAASQTSFSCANVGTLTDTLFVTDDGGNTSFCLANVTVIDTVAPVAICQPLTVQLDASGNAVITPAQVDNGSSDNCTIASLNLDVTSFDCSNVGANTVTLTATDVNGNSSSCIATVTVQDNLAPLAVCQPLTVQLDASGNATITPAQVDNGSSDNCAIASLNLDVTSFDCSNVGANTVTLTATDVNGNSSSCIATVTVQDNLAPLAVCQPLTVQLDASGNATITPAQVDNGSSDNCAIASLNLDVTSFDCSNVGANTVTLTATDVNGNSSSCTATITVQDNLAPVAVCQPLTVQLDASGNATITPAQVDNGSSDNCAIASLNLDVTSFDCSNVGANTVTLTATDVNGNSSSCTATVTVQDTVAPVAICQPLTVQLDASGNAVITPAQVDNGSSDNCAIASLNLDVTSFDCSNVGANTVTLTATDVNGNSSSCTTTVTVQDNLAPLAVCQPLTVQLDASGNATITPAQVDNGSSDNCAIASLNLDVTSFDCSNVGANTVTLTATDVNGNSSSCTATVTVQDNLAPVAICQPLTVQLDASGNATITPVQVDNGSSDNCAIASLNLDVTSFDCSNVGANTVTLTATDVNGNSSSCTATVTVQDNLAPSIVCPAAVAATTNSGCTATGVALGTPVTGDNCGVASVTNDAPGAFPIGVTTVTWTVTDNSGNTATCTQNVTVTDNVNPTISCPAAVAVFTNSGCTATGVALGTPVTGDNCAVASVTNDAPVAFPIGVTTVTWTVTDNSGNTATCTQNVTVTDNVNPVAICQPVTANLDGGGIATITAAQVDNGSSDNCGVASLSLTTYQYFAVGTYTDTLIVADAAGNVDSCFATITVVDNNPPNAVCNDTTLYLDAAGSASITPADLDGGSTDNGVITALAASQTSFSCANVGTLTDTLFVTDDGGNTSFCLANVTVIDTVAPVAICQPLTVQLDASGNAVITPAQVDNGSSDNCTIASLNLDVTSFDCSNVGVNTVTLTATDVNGNSSSCTTTVTVQDNLAPVAVCQPLTVQLDASGNATITPAQVDNGSSDNCAIASLNLDVTSFDCSNVGANTVTLTATDVNGNSSSCTATITVQDNLAPVAVCQPLTVQLDASGNATITPAQVDNGSSDNCAIASLNLDVTSFDCSNVGANTVTLTATDLNGNSSSCTGTITVQDTVAPTTVCQPATANMDGNGWALVTTAMVDGGSSDNCAITSLTVMPDSLNSVGSHNVQLIAMDAAGNSDTCTAVVTVVDNSPPVAICQPFTLYLNASGQGSLTGSDLDGGSIDNGTIVSLTPSQTNFNCNNLGANNVALTVTDDGGNIDICIAVVTVVDTIAPVPQCQPLTVQLDASGTASITTAQINIGSTDNCAVSTLSLDVSNFNCSNVGTNTVTLTVTDNSGNSSNCTATVTVQDNIAPAITCPANVAATTNSGCTATGVSLGSPVVTDNCPGTTVTNDAPVAFPIGTTTVTWTVTDASGNSASCTQTVTVADNVPPTALCQSVTIHLDAAGSATITANDLDAGSTDNCGIASIAADQTSFNCGDAGANTVTLTVTDNSGNTATCTATVTVLDTIAPNAICQPGSVALNTSGQAPVTAADVDGGSTDNCAITAMTVVPDTLYSVGTHTVQLIVADAAGNSDTCSATVTVVDNNPPNAVCNDTTLYLDAAGSASITPADLDGGSTDNGVITALAASQTSFSCANVGTLTDTLFVTDDGGNTSFCLANVTVIDTVAPVAICQPLTVQLDASGNAVITPAQVDNGSSDNCTIASLNLDVTSFDCSNVGANTVTLTATDVNGNSSSCIATVTVQDNLAPLAVCQPLTVQLDASGNATITPAQVDNGSSDNCAIASLNLDVTSFDCSNVGANTVTLTATDVNGNSSSCTATITVQDNLAPVAVCQPLTVQLDASGNATITPAQVDNGSSDNCAIASLNLDVTSFDCSNVGANTVTLTATDVNGNSSSCTATITVQDNLAPVAVCQPLTVQLDASGNATITPAQVDNGSSDNCAIASLNLDVTSFDCSNVGANTVTLTATDVNGNSSSCTAAVTVQDNLAPVTVCQPLTVQLDASGNATITPAQVDNGSSDNCAIASLNLDVTSFDCSNVGANTVTLTATDVNGNSSSCTATVTVQDTVAPVAVCQAVTTYLDASGNTTINAADLDVGSSDACGGLLFAASQTSFSCSETGSNTVTLTVFDANGNSNSCTATVTVIDTVAPSAICQPDTINLDLNGWAIVVPAGLDAGSTDNCSINILSTSIDSLSAIGTYPVTLTVTDPSGNVDSCQTTLTVVDNNPPNAVCQNATVYLDGSGNVGITPADLDGGSTDNGTIATITVSQLAFDCGHLGSNTDTLFVTDDGGNTSFCTAQVLVIDTINPVANCQSITVALDASGTAVLTGAQFNNGSTDNCGSAPLTYTVDLANPTSVGTWSVTLTATDASGNASTCQATLTVIDSIAPAAICQDATIYLDATGHTGIVPADIDGGSTDNDTITAITASQINFDCSHIGPNTDTLFVTDDDGNTSFCTATVTVLDTIAPIVACQAVSVALDATGTATITALMLDNGTTDNCGNGGLSFTASDSVFTDVGIYSVTLTVTDPSGNSSSCATTVTVSDNIPPVANCQPDTVYLDGSGNATITTAAIDAGSTDNDTITSYNLSRTSFDCTDLGVVPVVLTVSDAGGNLDSCSTTVTVLDTIAPAVACQNITVQLDPSGTVTITATQIDGGTTDNCGTGPLMFSADDTLFTDVGNYTVVLTVTDASGNSSTCNATVTVTDPIAPLAVCQPDTIYLDAAGTASITALDIDGGSTDNDTIVNRVASQYAFDCSDLGSNNVTLTVTDAAGNTDACTAAVTVLDTITPAAICQNLTITLPASGQVTITATQLNNGSTDNCGSGPLSYSASTTLFEHAGSFPDTLFVTDASGNTGWCISTVTVTDLIAPVAVCTPDTVYLNGSGSGSISALNIDGGSTDNGTIVNMTVSQANFNCSNIGPNNVTLIVTDEGGNNAFCTAVVTVLDTLAPVAICQNITVPQGSGGIAVISGTMVNNGSTDNCGNGLTYSVEPDTLPGTGTYTTTLTVTDASGNSSTCTSTVTVLDNTPPDAICQNITVYVDGNGSVTINGQELDGGSTDNDTIATYSANPSTFTCSNLGVNTSVLTVTDASGNTDLCVAQVTVLDTVSPNVQCQNITVAIGNDGTATISAPQLDNGTTDNCSGALTYVASQTFFPGTGIYPDTLIVTDGSGNTSWCVANVTVIDQTAPITICQDTLIYLDANGQAFINAVDLDGGSTDNGGSVTFAASQTSFDCDDLGNNPVTLYVTDAQGNIGSCTATVTVIDTIAPEAVCQDINVEMDFFGNASIAGVDLDGGSTDNCGTGSLSYTADITSFTEEGTFTVTLTVTDASGNSSTCTSEVSVKQPVKPLKIPSGFSPNGDGIADTWEIQGLREYPDNSVTIFNRWGGKLFEAKPYLNDWAGQTTVGTVPGNLPAGTYFYQLDLGNGEVYTGYLQVNR